MKPQDRLGIGVLVGCVLAAAALRVYHLDFQSLWLDELFSVVFSHSDLSVSQIIAAYASDVHPLGYPLVLHSWLEVFGDTPFAARALSAVFGILGVVAMSAFGWWCFGSRVGVIAAVLSTVNAFHIGYSQEARAYSLVFLLAALSYWSFVSVLARPGWRTAVLFGLATAAATHVHYYGVVVVVGQVSAALVTLIIKRWRWRRVLPMLAGVAGAGAMMVPWLVPMLRVAEMRDYWPAQPTPLFFLDYFHVYFGSQLILSLAVGGLLMALPFLLAVDAGREGQNDLLDSRTISALLGGAVALSLVAVYVRSVLVLPMLIPRVTIGFLTVVILLVALAISRIRPAWLGSVVVAGLAVASLVSLFTSGYYFEPHKEQWREAVQHMLSDPDFNPEADVCMGTLAPGFQFYVDQYASPFDVEEADPERLPEIVGGRPDLPTVWLLVARDEASVQGLRRELRQRWVRKDRVVYLGTSVERWDPKNRPD